MEFVLGSQPANWTTGSPPPSPASEGLQSVVVPGLPRSERRKRQMERDVALALMAAACVGLMGCVGVIWRMRKRRMPQDAATGEEEKVNGKGGPDLAAGDLKVRFLGRPVLFRFRERGTVDKKVEDDQGSEEQGGREKQVKVLTVEIPPPESQSEAAAAAEEPWTPRGTNRKQDPEVGHA